MRSSLIIVSLAFLPVAVPRALGQRLAPEEAVARMSVAEGLKARLAASEPLVRQPVAIDFDDRGRLWVIQYLQYPNPEGLKRVEVDRYSRTRYDRVPGPPPRGPKGQDRITVLEDRDGDGRMDSSHDFVSGLNLASGFAFGYGGVFVLNVPYLLFYPDRDRDDVPDGDPEVLVTGFGMEDAHSVANSLTWGPDGWLYGLQGSTVTARINGIEFQQGVWRYHPITRKFELFAEGGGNMWGLDFDRQGNLLASTNVGGNVMLHFTPGGYYWKQFGKHGALHNPYAFGYLDHVKHEGAKGGHVATGGLFYHADAWPDRFRGKYLSGDLLDHSAHWHELTPLGSTFQARQLGDILRANDTWFAPCDMTLGPEGSLYIADWHDKRTAHPDPDADWDRSNGRIIALDGPRFQAGHFGFDLQAYSSRELIEHLRHPNIWYVRRARRILSERRDPEAVPILRQALATWIAPDRLEALWTLYGMGSLDEDDLRDLLVDEDASIRLWAVRLLGERGAVSDRTRARLVALARDEPSVVVRAQLAASAQRLPARLGLDLVQIIALRDLDADDPQVPLLLWWALERHATASLADTEARFTIDHARDNRLIGVTLLPRLVRRLASAGGPECDRLCARLIEAPQSDLQLRERLLDALEQGLRARPGPAIDPALRAALDHLANHGTESITLDRLLIRVGDDRALQRAFAVAVDRSAPEQSRLAYIEAISAAAAPKARALLLGLAIGDDPAAIQIAALDGLGRFDDDSITDRLLAAYQGKPTAWKARARDLLIGRVASARAFLARVDAGRIAPADVPLDQVARIALLGDDGLDALVHKHWGRLSGPTPEEKLAEVRRLNNDLRAAPGDAIKGRDLFKQHCASCHRLFGEGQVVGPELTFANRGDRDFLLVSLVDPGGIVRKEFQASVLHLRDGRVITGLIAGQSPAELTVVGPDGARTTVARDLVEEVLDSGASLMPDNLYRQFTPDQLRDLFAYIQGGRPDGNEEPRP